MHCLPHDKQADGKIKSTLQKAASAPPYHECRPATNCITGTFLLAAGFAQLLEKHDNYSVESQIFFVHGENNCY